MRGSLQARTRSRWGLVMTALVLLPLGCDCSSSPSGNDSDGGPDAHLPDGDAADASPVDAGPDVVTSPCEEDLIVSLPPQGETILFNYTMGGHYALYTEWKTPGQTYQLDVFVFDLTTCEEIPVAVYEKPQMPAAIFGTEVVWTDPRNGSDLPAEYSADLYSYDLTTGIETRLTDTLGRKSVHKVMGDYIVYNSTEGDVAEGTFDLMLWDRASDDRVLLANYWEGAEGVGLSERYVTWGAFSTTGKDIFIYDILTGSSTQIEQPGSQYSTATTNDYLIFMTEENSMLHHVDLYSHSTGEVTRLDNGGYSRMWPHLQGNLATWTDYGYSQAEYGGPRDLVVHDLETGALRRVTTESDTYLGGTLDAGWMLYGLPGSGQYKYALYAINLYRAGILDEQDHVIP